MLYKQQHDDVGNMRSFYEVLKAVYGHSHQINIQAALRSADEAILLTDKEAAMKHWSVNFGRPFSGHIFFQVSSIAQIPQLELKENLNNLRSLAETKKSVVQLKICKSPGVDGISADVHKHG